MVVKVDLNKGEKIVKELRIHPLYYFVTYLIIGILALTIFGIPFALLLLLVVEASRRGNRYYITNKRIIHEFTFLSRKVTSASYNKVQDIHMSQGIFARMFGLGNIHINTAGTHLVEIKLRGIKNPSTAKRLLEKYV